MGAALLGRAVGDLTVDGGVEGTTETPVATIATPAGVPGTDKLIVARTMADVRNDSGAAQQPTWRWKFGPTGSLTTLHTFQMISLADDGPTNRYMFGGTLFLGGENATNAQRSMMDARTGGSNSGGGVYAGGNDHNTSVKSAAVDSSVANDLQLTAQLPTANSELECRRRGCWLELWDDSGSSGSRVLAKDVVDQVVSNTTTETNVFVGTVPSGEWVGNVVKMEQTGAHVNDTASSPRTYRVRVYVGGSGGSGGTLVSDFTSTPQARTASPFAAVQRWDMMALSSSVLAVTERFGFGGPSSDDGTFDPVTTPGGYQTNLVTGLSLSGATEVRITVTLGATGASHKFTSRGCWLVLVAPGSSGTRLLDLDGTGTPVDIASSTSAQTVYSQVIPGGTLRTDGLLILSLITDVLNTASTRQWWFDVFWGGVNIVNAAAGTNNVADANRRAAPLEVWIGAHGTTGEQMVAVVGHPISGTAGSGAGSGGNGGSANNSMALATVDSTVDQTLEIKVTFSAADANCNMRYHAGMLQLVEAVSTSGPITSSLPALTADADAISGPNTGPITAALPGLSQAMAGTNGGTVSGPVILSLPALSQAVAGVVSAQPASGPITSSLPALEADVSGVGGLPAHVISRRGDLQGAAAAGPVHVIGRRGS